MARRVPRSEWQRPKVRRALDEEWNKLLSAPWRDGKGKGTWDQRDSEVREASKVREEAIKREKVHFARIAELCYEKHSELDENDPARKMKGRAVLLGDNVKDEGFDWAQFQDAGSAPPSMEAVRTCLALGLVTGYNNSTNDAESAYTQVFLKGTKTYVHLPRDRWPKHWVGKYTNPVVPLILALYGHPDAGTHWEEYCVHRCGFEHLSSDGWSSVFWDKKRKAMLVVYVDDFLLAAPLVHEGSIWSDLRKVIRLGEPEKPDRFLGCYLRRFAAQAGDLKSVLCTTPQLYPRQKAGEKANEVKAMPLDSLKGYDPQRSVNGYIFDMEEYMSKNVERYIRETGFGPRKMKKASTPFVDESQDPQGYAGIGEGDASDSEQSESEAEHELLGINSPKPAEAKKAGADPEQSESVPKPKPKKAAKGAKAKESQKAKTPQPMNRQAAGIIMQTMYGARLARWEMSRCVGNLATYLTKWGKREDKKALAHDGIPSRIWFRQAGWVRWRPS